jgi:hypothetical protein
VPHLLLEKNIRPAPLPPPAINFAKKTQGGPSQLPTFFMLQQALQKNTQGGGHPGPLLFLLLKQMLPNQKQGGPLCPLSLFLLLLQALQSKREGGTHTSLF